MAQLNGLLCASSKNIESKGSRIVKREHRMYLVEGPMRGTVDLEMDSTLFSGACGFGGRLLRLSNSKRPRRTTPTREIIREIGAR